MRRRKTKKRLNSLMAIMLAVAMFIGNFSGLTLQVAAEEVEEEEGEYEINLNRFDTIIDTDDVTSTTHITISKDGYRLNENAQFEEFTNLYIGETELDELFLSHSLIIEGIPDGSTVSIGKICFWDQQNGIMDETPLIIKGDCTIHLLAEIQLKSKTQSCIDVRNGATLTLSGKGDLFAVQYSDEENVTTAFPTISGNGTGNLQTKDFTGHIDLFNFYASEAMFGDFANIDLNLQLYPNSQYNRRGELEIRHQGSGPAYKNCGNVTLEAYCFPFDSQSEGTWIEASGDVKIIDHGSGFDVSGYYYSKDEPLIKAKNFTYICDNGYGMQVGYNTGSPNSKGIAIQAEKKITFTGGDVLSGMQLIAPEIEMTNNRYIDLSSGDASPVVGNLKINNAKNVKIGNTIVDENKEKMPLFSGNVKIDATEAICLNSVLSAEKDLFTGTSDISYGDGYLLVQTLSGNDCYTDRVEGNFTLERESNQVVYNNTHKLLVDKNTTMTLDAGENDYGNMRQANVYIRLEEGEKISDIITMADGAKLLNYGEFYISGSEIEGLQETIKLHPDSTKYVEWSEYGTCIYTAETAWNTDNAKKATWNYISTDTDRASEVRLYKGGDLCQLDGNESITVSANEIDFTSYIEKEGYGDYTFSVTPVLTDADESSVGFTTKSSVYTYKAAELPKEENKNEENKNGNSTQDTSNNNQNINNNNQNIDNNNQDTNNNNQQTGAEQNSDNNQNDQQQDTTPAAEKGTKLKDKNAQYVVTKSGDEPTVEYKGTTNKKATTVKVPSTVKIDGVTYKVTSVEKNAFKNNKKIKKVTIGSNVKTIEKSAFSGCKNLKTVTLDSNLTEISEKAFYKCTSLKSITIPSKVSKIGSKAFYGCKNLKSITIKTTKLTKKNVGSNAFKGIADEATIKVPSKKVNTYKTLLKEKGISKNATVKKY